MLPVMTRCVMRKLCLNPLFRFHYFIHLLTSIISTIILAQSKALVSLTADHRLKILAEK
jgi:hypothetical protein